MAEVVEWDNKNIQKIKSDLKGQVKAIGASLGPEGKKKIKFSTGEPFLEGKPEEQEEPTGGLLYEVTTGTARAAGDGSSTASLLAVDLIFIV